MRPICSFRLAYKPEKTPWVDGFGQIICCRIASSGFIWAAWMENPNFWVVESIVSVLITVFLCVLVCIAIVLIGPLDADQEGEELDELS